jgi:hypothetical protein
MVAHAFDPQTRANDSSLVSGSLQSGIPIIDTHILVRLAKAKSYLPLLRGGLANAWKK